MKENNTIVNSIESKKEKKASLNGLLLAQFTEAFSDNAWKLVVITLATRAILPSTAAWDDAATHNSQVTVSQAIQTFLIPMLLFALPAGAIADRWSKRSIILAMKAIGILLMGAATCVLFFSPRNLWCPFLILALMGAQSATFNPAKNGILPEMLPLARLSFANGIVQMVNMLAIIAGTGLGAALLYFDHGGAHPSLTWTAPFILTIMATIAFLAALTIPQVSAAAAIDPKKQNAFTNSFAIIASAWKAIRSDKTLAMAVMGTALFWTLTSLSGQNLLVYSQALAHNLENGELWQGVPTAAFGVGIAIGALFSGKISGENIESGLIPFGTTIFALFALAIGIFTPQMAGTVALLILFGAGAGTLIVPLQALMQTHAPSDKRGAVLAISNTCDIVGLISGSLLGLGMSFIGWTLQTILIVSSLIAIAAALFSIYLLPVQFKHTLSLISYKFKFRKNKKITIIE